MIENSARHENIYIVKMYELVEGRNAKCLWHCCQRGRDIQKEEKIYKPKKEGERFIEGEMYQRGRDMMDEYFELAKIRIRMRLRILIFGLYGKKEGEFHKDMDLRYN